MPQFKPESLPRLSETPYFQCTYGHIFHRDHARLAVDGMGALLACPNCATLNVKRLPEAVEKSMRKFATFHETTFENLMVSMSFDNLNDCYHFPVCGNGYGCGNRWVYPQLNFDAV